MRKTLPAALSIIGLWAAVAAIGVSGKDIVVEHQRENRTHRVAVPVVAGVALFAAVATMVVALVGLRNAK